MRRKLLPVLTALIAMFALVTAVAGPGQVNRSVPPAIAPLTPRAKQQLLSKKRLKKDPSGKTKVYSLQHPYNGNDYLFFLRPKEVSFGAGRTSDALFDGDNGPSGLQVNFTPIAANKPHLVIFTIGAHFGSKSVIVQGQDGPAQTVNLVPITNYVSIVVQPTSTSSPYTVSLMAPTPGASFYFDQVSVELVKK